MLNSITLMGRLTKDPELRTTSSGISVASFSIAVERDVKGADGKREADFIDIVAWRTTAEIVTKYFHKGDMIIVAGRLQIQAWTDKNGQNRRSAQVLANSVYFGGAKKTATPPAGEPEFTEVGDDGELPF